MENLPSGFDSLWPRYEAGKIKAADLLGQAEVSKFAEWVEAKILAATKDSPIQPASLKKLAEELAPTDKAASIRIRALFSKVVQPPREMIECVADIDQNLRKTTLEHLSTWTLYSTSGYREREIWNCIKAIPAEQRAEVVRQLTPLVLADFFYNDVSLLKRVVSFVTAFPPQQIPNVTGEIITFFSDVSDHHRRFEMLDYLQGAISRDQLQGLLSQVNPLVQGISDGLTRIGILHALSEIAAARRQAVLSHATGMILTTPDGNERRAILGAFIGIPPNRLESYNTRLASLIQLGRGESRAFNVGRFNLLPAVTRAFLLQSPIRDSDMMRAVNEYIELLESPEEIEKDKAYTVNVAADELETHPTHLLDILTRQFANRVKTLLRIRFAGEVGVDSGGLGRQFINDLFSGVLKQVGCPKNLDNDLYQPKLEKQDPEMQKIYRQLGQVMMFCLNASREYPIGQLFDESLFIALKAFQDDDLDRDFNVLLIEFDALFRVYEAMSSPEKMKNIRPLLSTAEGRRQFAEDYLTPELLPLFELAKGMKSAPFGERFSWQAVREMAPSALSKQLQGSISRPELVQKLHFDARIPEAKQLWLKQYIEKANDESIKQFLYTMTGSTSIGSMEIKIHDNSPAEVNQEAPLYFHTCFNAVDIPFAKITSDEQFKAVFESTLGGCKKYNRD